MILWRFLEKNGRKRVRSLRSEGQLEKGKVAAKAKCGGPSLRPRMTARNKQRQRQMQNAGVLRLKLATLS